MELTRNAALACTVALALSGCSAAPEGSKPADASRNNRSSSSSSFSAPSIGPIESETSKPEWDPEPEDSTLVFGEFVTYRDGLVVNVSKPKAFQPSRSASFERARAYVRFTVTIVNRTGKTFDPSLFFASLQSADQDAGAVFDSQEGLEPGPFTRLLRGEAAQWDIAFGVRNPADLVMEVTPGGVEHKSVIYTTTPSGG